MEIKCNAKINLALDVVGKREDGYHLVELIYKEIPLYDTIDVVLRNDGEIRLKCDDRTLPTDNKNIAYRAAELFFAELGKRAGADISIEKRIPHGAGLGGGSSDAAGVLKALNALEGEPFDNKKLMEIGTRLGADVPFFIIGGCAIGEGIGEVLSPLPDIEGFTYVVAKPQQSVSTAFVYQNLDISKRPQSLSIPDVAEGIRRGDKTMIFENSANILETVTEQHFPIITEIKQSLKRNGAKLSLMSGSGTSVFGIFLDKESANVAATEIKRYTNQVYVL